MRTNPTPARFRTMKEYRVNITNRHGTPIGHKCRIQVSLGNPRYEGEKLASLIKWCGKRYDTTEIILSDTLQRHNRNTPHLWWDALRSNGEEWIERNGLTDQNIIKWDDLLNRPDYSETWLDIYRCVNELPELKRELGKTAKFFADKNGVPQRQCTAFLLEEMTAFQLLFKDPADDIYAGSWITPLLEKLPKCKNFHCISVDFERKKLQLAA